MTAAFVVHLVVSDTSPAYLAILADDLADDLISSGHDVEEVRPWAREGLSEPAPLQVDPASGFNNTMPLNPFGQ